MLSDSELLEVNGGSKYLVVGIVVSIITFFIGVYDGYLRPLKCNE